MAIEKTSRKSFAGCLPDQLLMAAKSAWYICGSRRETSTWMFTLPAWNVEHYLCHARQANFSAMGDATALSNGRYYEGPLAGRTALYAEIEPD